MDNDNVLLYLAVWLHAWYVNLYVGIDGLQPRGDRDGVAVSAGGVAVPVRVHDVHGVHAPAQGVQQPLLPGHQPVQVQAGSVARINILQFAKSEMIQGS